MRAPLRMRLAHRRQKTLGFSLLEMTIVLLISGLMGLVAWKLMASARPVAQGDPVARALLEAQQALEGFAQANYRLPCPALTPGGTAEVACAGAVVGWFPAASLGLSQTNPLRYTVSSPLTTAASRFTPLLPPTGSSIKVNGLDFCLALNTASGATAGGVPVAFALAHPGANRIFEGLNTGAGVAFEGPGKAESRGAVDYDDKVLAAGAGEMFAHMGCVTRLGEVSGAARAAFSAYDMDRLAIMYSRFRAFAVKVNATNEIIANTGVALAALGLAIAIGTEVSGIAFAAETGGVATPQVVIAGANVGFATAGVVLAAKGLSDAQASLVTARAQATEAVAFQLLTQQRAADTLALALAQDTKGLLP